MKFDDLVFGCNEPEVIHAEERQCHRQTEALLFIDKRVIFQEVKEVGLPHLWNNGVHSLTPNADCGIASADSRSPRSLRPPCPLYRRSWSA